MASTNGEALILRPDVVATTLENEAVLLDLQTKFFYSLNASAWAIAQLFEAGATREQVEDRCRGWGIEDERLGDVALFVDRLVEEKLVAPAANGNEPPEVVFAGEWVKPVVEKHKEPLQRIMISAFDPTLPLAE